MVENMKTQITNIWELVKENINANAPAHTYLGAGQFDASYNPKRHAYAVLLSDGKTPVHYQWSGDHDATQDALNQCGVAYRYVMHVCWVDDVEAAKAAVNNHPQTKDDQAE